MTAERREKWPADAAEYVADGLLILHGDDEVASVSIGYAPPAGFEAQLVALAQLYVTAPRLYAALFALVDEAEPNKHERPALRVARAALAAARGEQP